ncbi:MAG: PilZ domain-containing protein [Candidatus Electrothrix communis]|nr:MAG: PilZ domain-containing protein [Candidatus Electrothrix communis]
MDANNGILCPIPEDERTPFVDVLLKFIDWQKVRIENAEGENKKLKERLAQLEQRVKHKNSERPEATRARENGGGEKQIRRRKIVDILKVPHKGAVGPENIQRVLVQNIQNLLINIGNRNQRQFTRLAVPGDANLDFGAKEYYKQEIKDISLCGMYVKGSFDQRAGDICSVILNPAEIDVDLEIHAACTSIRVDQDGIALEFISMRLKDFCFLQTVLLNEADDPFVLGTEFVNNADLELEEDLIICQRHRPPPHEIGELGGAC